jgi:hypothetical protein
MGELPVVNAALIPAAAIGYPDVRINTTGAMGYRDPDGVGAFRTLCNYSHMNFDDAIVFPGQPGTAHLHVYFGNTSVNASTTPANITERGNGTCEGGIANRTGYWMPAMIDTRNGAPMQPDYADVYYKTGYQGNTNASIRPMPPGLRMIAGDSKNTIVMPRWQTHVEFGCDAGGQDTMPVCTGGQDLQMWVEFPQCWDGVNLDSPDHKSHMAYGTGNGCPATHPIPLPVITIKAHYTVPAGTNTSTWRLSSDRNGATAGTSGHADWMNGWRGQTSGEYLPNIFVTRLLNPGLSGGSYMIGDGRVIY